MATILPITEDTLRSEYVRLSREWRERSGLDYNKIIFMHRERRSLLVALQRPDQREPGDANNFIMRLDSLEAFYRYEQRGKDNNKNGGMRQTSQIRVFFVSETFNWARKDFPTDKEILCDGRTETLENIRSKVRSLRERLFIFHSRAGEIFFLDEEFEPQTLVGFDPDSYEDEVRPRQRDSGVRDIRDRQLKQVKITLNDGSREFFITIPDYTVAQVVSVLEEHFGGPLTDELPF